MIRTRSLAIASLFGIVLLCSGLFAFGFLSDVMDFDLILDAKYETIDAVRDDEAIVRGWIPEQLPRTAVNITERHDLDTNVGWGRFEFETIDLKAVEEHWERRDEAGACGDPNRFWGQPHFRWDLEEMESPEAFYSEPFWMVVDQDTRVGFFWQENMN